MNQFAYRLPRIYEGFTEIAFRHIDHCDGITLHHGLIQTVSLIQSFLCLRLQLVRTLG